MTVRVRYAPSPTGHLHIGGVRTALFNFLFARHYGGQFIIRSEDTDLDRNVEGAEQEFLDGFRWLGMDYDEGPDIGGPYAPYRCTARLETYRLHLQRLENQGDVYPCFCSQEELQEERVRQEEGGSSRFRDPCRDLNPEERAERLKTHPNPSWRLKIIPGTQLEFEDGVRGHMSFLTDDMDDFVVMKSNGIPTYQFQVVVDDALMKITHVIRGEEHLPNTPKQMLVYRALGYPIPEFVHLPQVLDASRKKLSKRDKSVLPVLAYREKGYVPSALVNFLALLGWSPGGEEEILGLDELIARFSLERVNKSGAVFDVQKLHWMAQQYVKQLPIDTLVSMVRQQLDKVKSLPSHITDDWLVEVASLLQEYMASASDFLGLAETFLHESVEWSEEARSVLQEDGAKLVVEMYLQLSREDTVWTADSSRARCKQIQANLGVKGRGLFMPIRAALTGQAHGPDLQRTIAALPKDWALARLELALKTI